jgi:hypothetical protein
MSLLVTVIAVLNVWDSSGSNSNVRAILKVTSSEQLTKQAMRKKMIIYKNDIRWS